jgi:hypothetical protein
MSSGHNANSLGNPRIWPPDRRVEVLQALWEDAIETTQTAQRMQRYDRARDYAVRRAAAALQEIEREGTCPADGEEPK